MPKKSQFKRIPEGVTSRVARFAAKDRVFVLQPTVLVLATFILLLASRFIDVTLLNRDNEYYSVVILQMMIFLVPGIIWCIFSGEKYIKNLRLRPFGADSLILILCSVLAMISGTILIAVLFGGMDSLSSNFSLYDTFISKDDGTVPVKLYLVLAYAALPALCEEFVYRGILCNEFERGGVSRGIILSSLFFAMLHFNLSNFPIFFFCGAVLALTMYSSRSVFAAAVAHFLYNLFGLFGQPYMATLYSISGGSGLFLIVITVVFITSAAVFCGESARLYRRYLYKSYSAEYRLPEAKNFAQLRRLYIDPITKPSVIACFVIYIIVIIFGL